MSALPDLRLQATPEVKSKAKQPAKALEEPRFQPLATPDRQNRQAVQPTFRSQAHAGDCGSLPVPYDPVHRGGKAGYR